MGNIAMCMVAKVFLMPVFVSIDVTVSAAAKQKAWLCLCGSLGAGMLLITPLGSTPLHAIGCRFIPMTDNVYKSLKSG